MQIHRLLRTCGGKFKLWQSTSEHNFMTNSIHNFILEHSKITHKGRCNTSGVWGSWLWLWSHHDGDSILSASTAVQYPSTLYHEETCRRSRPLRSQTRGWKSRPRLLFKTCILLCRWRDRQLDQEPRTPLPLRISVLFTSIPFIKCLISITLVLNNDRTSVTVSKEQ